MLLIVLPPFATFAFFPRLCAYLEFRYWMYFPIRRTIEVVIGPLTLKYLALRKVFRVEHEISRHPDVRSFQIVYVSVEPLFVFAANAGRDLCGYRILFALGNGLLRFGIRHLRNQYQVHVCISPAAETAITRFLTLGPGLEQKAHHDDPGTLSARTLN